jgi:hypothetical protein
MSRKIIDAVAEGRRGGNMTKERHGIEHFRRAAKIGRASLLKRDPEWGKRRAALMQRARMAKYHERQVKEQKWLAAELGERFKIVPDKTDSSKFFNKLIGQG